MIKDKKEQERPAYIFEISWEVCNKLGGIYTVISTKATLMQELYGAHFIMIGPDLYKGAEGNTEFSEDPELFKTWQEQLKGDGLKLRIGRWNIPSRPIVFLIDFSPLFANKDRIFSELWNRNRLDSLMGGWDYIEPALFGVSAGMIIERFSTFHLMKNEHAIAHFHEWLTGSGILYLENSVPDIATVFTSHATVTGRALCGSGQPFYRRFETYNGDQVAKDFNVTALHSLEKTAAITADAFTTVSDNTARECLQLLGKAVDRVATNGFDDSFLPNEALFEKKRTAARKILLKVASSVIGYSVADDAFLVATSGRYEFKNKGIDIFIDAMGDLNRKENTKRQIIAFVLVPAAQTGPKQEVIDGLNTGNFKKGGEPSAITHYLQDPDHDVIWQQIKNRGLNNEIQQKVKIIYAPIYLDGRDGVFNLPYYDILIGLDLTVFPSFYEPFGYTPLESLAYRVPTVTTTLTGFGQQVKSRINNFKDYKEGILVIDRSDFNDRTVTDQIANHIEDCGKKDEILIQVARKKAFEISRFFLWKNLIQNYDEVYRMAIERHSLRVYTLERLQQIAPKTYVEPAKSNEPIWKSAMVKFKIPNSLNDLGILSKNLWWTWHPEASRLFASIDTEIWEQVNHNPIALLNALDYKRFLKLEKDKTFMSVLKAITKEFDTYMADGPNKTGPKIAYLCMEYGLHESIPIYSGGLGILAGDFLKEASDQKTDMIAFGLLYRYGYFDQALTIQGEQVAQSIKQHFTLLPIRPVLNDNGDHILLSLPLGGPIVNSQVWKLDVGRISLYLFDTDIPENGDENKKITHNLYGGDNENRFKQELLLAVNTLQLLEILKITPDLYHYNEGHTAFTGLIRTLRLAINENLSFEEAGQFVKASTLFTTHTPVPAGQDAFDENLLRSYQSHFADTLNIPWERFLGYGKINPLDHSEKFTMSYLAARTSGEINAVSEIHAEVTRKMFNPLWRGLLKEELQIKNVTNGVHLATWIAPAWQQLFVETLGADFLHHIPEADSWAKIKEIPSQKIMDVKKSLKIEFLKSVVERTKPEFKNLHKHPNQVYRLLHSINENDFIIGFARRFASYKRAGLLFKDTARLAKIVNNKEYPVKFIFAGKAHPADTVGQELIKQIITLSEKTEFEGKILFVQNYDMALAHLFVQGVDLWLSTPERGKEASGTSGMKAVLNGTLNFSVFDGWWAEAYRNDSGWALSKDRIYENVNDQDDFDAETIYNILENEIIPEYFEVNKHGVPEKWIARIKNAFKYIAPQFTTKRMLKEYRENYYDPMYERANRMKLNGYEQTKNWVVWSKKVNEEWPKISVVDVQVSNGIEPLELGDKFDAEVTLDLAGLSANDIGVELVFAKCSQDRILQIQELSLVSENDHQAVYRGQTIASISGAFQYDIRFFPKNPDLIHRRDLPLVKWI